MNKDLKLIKKYYGEDMMHYARDNFSTILEQEGVLSNIFINYFAENKNLYELLNNNNELIKFKNYIFSIFFDKESRKNLKVNKTPDELLKNVGYTLYECKTEEDIQTFRKYYVEKEELCTFRSDRLKKCYVFFAVKENANLLKREDFKNPERQDEYGTSVISIQFTKDETHSLSIKNRYNHTVNNPDATFKNNLDNIILGLTYSFDKHYGMKQKFINNEDFKNMVRANDGKYYIYNYEIIGIYYCDNNIIINNLTPKKLKKEKYIIMDYFILNLQDKSFENKMYIFDTFIDTIKNIEKIEVVKKDNNKLIIIKNDGEDINIEINKYGQIIKYINNNVKEIKTDFLKFNKTLEYLELDNVISIEDNFLFNNQNLKFLSLKNVETINNNFMQFSNSDLLKKISFPKLKIIGNNFMSNYNNGIEEIYLPNVETIGDEFFKWLESEIKIIDFPNLKKTGYNFIKYVKGTEVINLPKIELLPENFLINNDGNILIFNIPSCKIIMDNVLFQANVDLNNAHFDSLEKIGNSFLKRSSIKGDKLYMPNLLFVADDVLCYANNIKYINLPKLKSVGRNFLCMNEKIKELHIDNIENLGEESFEYFIKKYISKDNSLNSEDLLVEIKKYSEKLNKLNNLRELKNQIIQSVYTKRKKLRK